MDFMYDETDDVGMNTLIKLYLMYFFPKRYG